MQRPYFDVIIIVVLLASSIGCGGASGPTGTISGKLTLNGSPAPQGTHVQFLSDAGASSAEVSGDGSFTIMGVAIGSYKVMVTPGVGSASSGAMDPETAMRLAYGEGPDGTGKNPDAFKADAAIPAKYTDIATSEVSFDVKEGVNDFSLDMKE